MSPERLAELAGKAKEIDAAVLPPINPLHDLHIDGDYAAYYFSGNDETTVSSSKANMKSAIMAAQSWGGVGGNTVLHLTSGMSDKGGRFKIATVKPYQGQRDASRKPNNWEAIRTWMESEKTLPGTNIRVVIWADREADDGVAAAARYAWTSGRVPVIFSRDKDFRMIPGLHISWTTYERMMVQPTDWAKTDSDGLVFGQKWFWLQMLQGDAADAIPGLEGVAAKSAGKFKACGEGCAGHMLDSVSYAAAAYSIVQAAYADYYGQAWPDRFAEQAALLWLRTDNKADVGDFLRAIPQRVPALELAVTKLKRRIA